ncbi:MAG: S41 family peptidase [Armatimonadetes bacterium]|nr:S41 family peptidase [Armatimonadota bacterium]
MPSRRHLIALVIFLSFPAAATAQGKLLPLPVNKPIIGIEYPALSPDGKTLCFSYLGDLWTVPVAGGVATRLTVNIAQDGYPRWSPDGHWIAFSSVRTGNYDIFIIPATGGKPRQITFNSAPDFIGGWSPDGSKLIFTSIRDEPTLEQYSINVATGHLRTLTHDLEPCRYGVYSPDGKSIAYMRSGMAVPWWRPRYIGSMHADIYTKNLVTDQISRITHYDGMNMWPLYSPDGKYLYFTSNRDCDTPNLFRKPVDGGKAVAVTHYKTGTVRYPDIAVNGSLIAYEYGGGISVINPNGGKPHPVTIYAPSDEKVNNHQRITLTGNANELAVSPDGKTIAMVIRGNIWTIPADKGGEATRLTKNSFNNDQIDWSPDSTKIAFVSDRSGTDNIYVKDVKTKATTRITNDLTEDTGPTWSPGGKKIAFLRSGSQGGLYVAPATGGEAIKLADSAGNNLFGVGINSFNWSPDSQWIAYSRRDPLNNTDIWIVPSVGGTSVNVTRYPGENVNPTWSQDGKFLVFQSDRHSQHQPSYDDLYVLPLLKHEPKPSTTAKPGGPVAKKPVVVKIDFNEIQDRARQVTYTTNGVAGYALSPDGATLIYSTKYGGDFDFWSVPTAPGGAPTRISTGNQGSATIVFAPDGSKFYYLAAGGTVRWMPKGGGGPSFLPFVANMELNRRAELHEAFNQFWRMIDVGFYDPKMHGVNWAAIKTKYEPRLSSIATPEDFANLLSEMIGELNTSHSEIGSASGGPPGPQTATLAMTFDENYPGPGLKVVSVMPKSPADENGHRVKPDEYILSIDGTDVSYTESYYKTLQNKAGKDITLLVNSKPTKTGAHDVKLKPITQMAWENLWRDQYVKNERKDVEKLSDGRLAYINVKAMDDSSLRKFERQLFGDAQSKQGLVLDMRFNGGGFTHDKIVNILSRDVYGYTQPRDAYRSTQPFQHWNRPVVLLVNQDSASDTEIFANAFKTLKIGPVVGVPTPGYVIGTYDTHLVDGTAYRIPMWGWYTLSGRDMENHGVVPNVDVPETPQDIQAHKDVQLEAAVKVLLKMIK